MKTFIRRFGIDIVKYRSFWDDVAAKRGIKAILDIGANDGTFAAAMRQRFPDARIISFEPLAAAFQKLQWRMRNDATFHAFNLALGESGGDTMIYHSASDPSSSLLPMAALHKRIYPQSAPHTQETIRIARLDDVLENEQLLTPMLVKIDVQGFEASVIKGGSEIIGQADIVLVENSFVELYEGQALFGSIHTLLQELGFSYRGRAEVHYDPATNEPIYEDSVFIKTRTYSVQ